MTLCSASTSPLWMLLGDVARVLAAVGRENDGRVGRASRLAGRRAEQWLYLSMRVSGDPANYIGPLRQALYARDPTFMFWPQRLEDVVLDHRNFFKSFSRALIGLGSVTLVLAMSGVYAMMRDGFAAAARIARPAFGSHAERVVR